MMSEQQEAPGCAIGALIHRLGYFIEFSAEDRQRLSETVAGVARVEKGQDINVAGSRPDHVHVIVEGWACRYKYLEDGTRSIMAYLIPGDISDVHIALLDHMDHSVSAMTPVKTALIPRAAVNDIFENYTSLAYALFWASLVEESTLREWFVNVTSRPADKRLAHILCEMQLRHYVAGLTREHCIEFPLTQAELADAMGISVVHTNRVLQKLRKDGLLTVANRQLTIHDWERLKAFAGFDPGYMHLSEDIMK
ncbi:MAG: Crp/Fnr family transcriptional regulator [Halomonas sp.]|nr:Crp/Fnr family transcriptional regulator [Halomonas sp.]